MTPADSGIDALQPCVPRCSVVPLAPTRLAWRARCGREAQKALAIASAAANQLASERLVLFHPELVPMLQWRGASC